MKKNNKLSYDELIPILKNVTVFSGVDEAGIRALCKKCKVITANVGEVIIEQDTPATEIFILLSGTVSIQLGSRNDPFELLQFGPGNCLGEASVIGIQKHCASAVAIKDAMLFVLSRSVLMEIFKSDKSLFSLLILNIARELARRLYHSDEMIMKYKRGMKPEH